LGKNLETQGWLVGSSGRDQPSRKTGIFLGKQSISFFVKIELNNNNFLIVKVKDTNHSKS